MTAQTPVSSADEVLRLIEKASEKNFLPIIGPYKGKILAEEVRKAKPQACFGGWHINWLLSDSDGQGTGR